MFIFNLRPESVEARLRLAGPDPVETFKNRFLRRIMVAKIAERPEVDYALTLRQLSGIKKDWFACDRRMWQLVSADLNVKLRNVERGKPVISHC